MNNQMKFVILKNGHYHDEVFYNGNGIFKIGRIKDNDLILDSRGISRVHAELQVVSGVLIIKDNKSLNGLFINGKKQDTIFLNNGDVISLGGKNEFQLIVVISPEFIEEVKPLENIEGDYIHCWFGLSYSNYLVLPRSVLQSMPEEWQKKFIECLDQLSNLYSGHPYLQNDYMVKMRDDDGKFITDELSNYERGRRFIKPVKI